MTANPAADPGALQVWRLAACVPEASHGRFLLRASKNEERDEDEQRIHKEPEDAEDNGQSLANPGRNLSRPDIRHRHGQERAKNATAVHRERWNQVEQHQHYVYGGKL